jgi:hypothetical protein
MEDASLYAGAPQVQNARQAQISSQVLPTMMQNRMQTNAQNVQTDMGARQFNAQIANQAAMLDAQISTQLGADNARYAMNKAKEKVAGRTMSKNMLNQLITNAGDTYLMNQWYPQYAFNPSDYSTYFESGKGNDLGQQSASQQQSYNYNDLYPQFLAQTKAVINDQKTAEEEARKLTMEFIKGRTTTSTFDPRQSMMNSRRQVRTNNMIAQPGSGEMIQNKMGGFIPMYQLGGWY